MDENYFEKLLSISTDKVQNLNESTMHYNRYEPTSYSSLEEFFKDHPLSPKDEIVDFGCGLGRLNFYLNYKFGAKTTGIEMNEELYNGALKNLESFKDSKYKSSVSFFNGLAEEYNILDTQNIFYFFNPFSVQIFMKVLENILTSVCKAKRNIFIILYYPSEDYIFFIENCNLFSLVEEVKLKNFNKDSNERFLIYKNAF
ncbi:MAG: SAM-dependent methyltransferase [Clostridium sp.]|uniref:SAM-dependent methyltransferase n=1 Tax=Clostridium sp. TaxID=1506 RepID=UPI003EE7ACED